MSKAQIWILLVIVAIGIFGGLWVTFYFYDLAEKRAWLDCIKENDQLSATNLVCRSQYPNAYQRFQNQYQGK